MKRAPVIVSIMLLFACGVQRPPADASGAEIYSMLCANCHGAGLEGGRIGPSLGPGSNSAGLPDSFLETTIEHGRGRMPSFSTVLSDQQMARLIEHIRQVQQQ
ncbi:MAG: c-type cytochrome [Acidimicrobiia bacterium]